jgi:DNA-directed RNA polymerase specialized sigma24 family protein
MPNSHVVAQHVPYLRRYARALTGDQISGDSYVAATLEALVKEPELLESETTPKVTIFRLFPTIWNSLAVNRTPDVRTDLAAERNLAQITPKPRQAFLLISVEGFSEEEAARILNVDAATLLNLVDESGRELAAELATDVIIIEDELLISATRRTTSFGSACPSARRRVARRCRASPRRAMSRRCRIAPETSTGGRRPRSAQ